jgi:hypothetical protein
VHVWTLAISYVVAMRVKAAGLTVHGLPNMLSTPLGGHVLLKHAHMLMLHLSTCNIWLFDTSCMQTRQPQLCTRFLSGMAMFRDGRFKRHGGPDKTYIPVNRDSLSDVQPVPSSSVKPANITWQCSCLLDQLVPNRSTLQCQ